MAHSFSQYPNLFFSNDALKSFASKDITPQAKSKILSSLDRLNIYGTDPEMIGLKKIENLGRNGWWAIRIKDRTVQWRIMFRKISNSEYGVAYIYKKKSPKIPQKDFEACEHIAKKEKWVQ
jgi:phage-related protein